MEKTINQIKSESEVLKNEILKLINKFENDNPNVDVQVTVKHLYEFERGENNNSHKVEVNLGIK